MPGTPAATTDDAILKEVRDIWLEAIQAGLKEKDRTYAKGAAECLKYYLGEYRNDLFAKKGITDRMAMGLQVSVAPNNQQQIRYPVFRLDDNVAANFVQIYGPFLIQGEIVITATANKPFMPPMLVYGIDMQPRSQDPMYLQQQMGLYQQYQIDQMSLISDYQIKQAISEMIEKVANYCVKELGLFTEREQAIIESLIVGGGPRLTEIVQLPGTQQKLVGSNFITMNDLVYDPDARRDKDCKWMAVQCRHPAWLVARLYGIPEEDLRPNTASTVSEKFHDALLTNAGRGNVKTAPQKDEVVYWKIWSRMGCGTRLRAKSARTPALEAMDQQLGDWCFLVVTDCCDYPLNFGPHTLQQAAQIAPTLPDPMQVLRLMVQWPIQFYYDVDDPWPITLYRYHHRNNSPYPVPHLEFCLSYIKFLVWVICFVADKTYRSNRDFWLIDESVSEQLKQAIIDGEDEAIIKLRDLDQKTVQQFVQMLEAPGIKKELLDVYAFFENKFQKASGLTDLLQAQFEQASEPRSATQSSIMNDASKLRPNDMAAKVKRTDTRIARKEAIAALSILGGQDVQGVLGIPGARFWDQVKQSIPIPTLLRETTFEVMSNEGRPLDLQTRADQSNEMAQFVLPLLVQVGQATGNFDAANQVLTEWYKSRQIEPILLPNMPPPIQQQAAADAAVQEHAAQVDKGKEEKAK